MKKILTVALLWTALCGTAFPQNAGDFTVDANGVITKYIGFDTAIVIPATIGGKSVTAIGKGAFQKADLTSVTIPNSVTEIGESAFAQNQITSVTIGTGVKSIGKSAFSGNKLTSVTIPNGSIGESAFAGNQLTSVTIGNGVTYIGKSAFSGNRLTSVTIPNGSIGESAFAGDQLTSVTIGNGVTSIGESAFSGNQLTSVTIGNGVTSIEKSAFSGNQLTSVTVPCSVEERAFYGNPLATIVLSKGAESIGKEAFANTKCTSVSLPSTVNSIASDAFDTSGKPSFTLAANINANFPFFPMFYSYIANDRKAETFAFDAQSVRKYADDYEYYENKYGAVLTNYTGSSTRVRIPAEIGGVTVKAFVGTFQKNPLVVAVQIPESVTYIGVSSFLESRQLAGVTIPDSVTYIGDNAFKGCTSLASVTIPKSVTSIGDGVFDGCTSLTAITVAADNTTYSSQDGVLYNKNKITLIKYPGGKAGAFTIPNSVTSIGREAFKGCTSLTSVTIPSSVTSIGGNAFLECTGLTSVTFQGTIPQREFTILFTFQNGRIYGTDPFPGDLRGKFYARDEDKGTPGTYTRPNGSMTWTKR